MKTKTSTLCGLLLIGITACIPSLKPFYMEKDVVFEAKLLGSWQQKEDAGELWKFASRDTNRYTVTIRAKDEKHGQFQGTLFQLGTNHFLDLIPSKVDMAPDQLDLVGASIFPGHLLVHVNLLEAELRLAFFDFDKLSKILKDQPKALNHYQEDDRIILTAETPDLQKFILQHLEHGRLFAEPGLMVRKSPENSEQSPSSSSAAGN